MVGVRVLIYFACLVVLFWGVLGFPLRGRKSTLWVGAVVVVLALCGRRLLELPVIALTPFYLVEPGVLVVVFAAWALCFVLIKGLRPAQCMFFLLVAYRAADVLHFIVLQNRENSALLWPVKTGMVCLGLLCLLGILLIKGRQAVYEALQSVPRLPYWSLDAVLLVCDMRFIAVYGAKVKDATVWTGLELAAGETLRLRYCVAVNFAVALLCVAVLVFIWQRQVLQEKDRANRQCIRQQTAQYHALYDSQQALRSFRHDVKAHIRALQSLTEQNDVTGIERYLKDMGQMGAFSGRILQVNHVIGDALLNEYRQRGEKDGIEVRAMGYFPVPLTISEIDLCVILSNLMENAYTAAQNTPAGQERFVLAAIGNSDELLQIAVSNSLDQARLQVAGEKLHTTKGDGLWHGFGLKNVEQAVQKYGGDMRWSLNDEETEIEVVINFPKNRGNDSAG